MDRTTLRKFQRLRAKLVGAYWLFASARQNCMHACCRFRRRDVKPVFHSPPMWHREAPSQAPPFPVCLTVLSTVPLSHVLLFFTCSQPRG